MSMSRVLFTDWQVAIIEHWAEAGTATEAARCLSISENTFQTHLKRLRRKVKVNRTVDVYRYMLQNGYLSHGTGTQMA